MDIQALLTLQDEDGRIRELQHELKVLLPKHREEAKRRLKIARDAVDEATQENLAATREYERFQRDYTRNRDIMSRAERNATGMTRARSLEAAQQEHDSAAQAAAQAEAAAMAADQSRTPTERKLDLARAHEAEEEIAVQAIYNEIDARRAAVEAELEKVKAHREELAQAVAPDLLKYYTRLSLTRWPVVVDYSHANGVCTGCNLVQPPSVKQAVLASEETASAHFVTCPACGRILK